MSTTPIEDLAPWTEEQVQAHLRAGKLVEGLQHMSPKYLEGMRRILTVSADTELVSAPSYLRAASHAPALNNFGSAMSIIQDELAHAHIGYRLLGDLGVDMDWLIYERPAPDFKYPYAFDVPLDSWVELVCANALYDQAGFVLLSDVYHSSTFGPWKRALAKVDKEETFHLRHGRTWLRKLVKTPEGKAEIQQAIDWMFMLTLEWFGLPDDRKQHSEQLDYGFKGKSNDALRKVEDPEIPVSVVGMGLIVSLTYQPEQRLADLKITFTAMGCPAMDFIEEDIREALLKDPDVDAVGIEVVWDPIWTKDRLRADARAEMRRLGIAV